jgi:hypothetical protein
MDTDAPLENFDALFLGYTGEEGTGHLPDEKAVAAARRDEDLLLSNEAEMFCSLIIFHGKMPSEAYLRAFSTDDEFGNVTKPDSPAFRSRQLLKVHEIKVRIKEMRDEIAEWGKTSFEEVEANLRSIALSPTAKESDRIAATKALSNLRGFDAQPEGGALAGATIVMQMPFIPNNLAHRPAVIDATGE